MSYLRLSRIFLPALALAIFTGAARAQPSDSDTNDAATLVAPSGSAIRIHEAPAKGRESWWWVHAGVTVQWAGTFGDWATSWKQPEGNSALAQSGGQYAGRFYRTGTVLKFGLAGGVTALSYAIAWKWPKARKYAGIFNMTMGGAFAGQAIRNAVVNPYYRP